MKNKFGPVWVIAEQDNCRLEVVSLQLLGKARELADALGVACEAVLLGDGVEEAAQKIISAGADRVFVGEAPALRLYQPALYTDIICSLAEEHGPEIVLIGSTCMGRELAPLVAARLRTGLAAHCTGLLLDAENNLKQQIPAYGGLMSILCPDKRPQMATIAKGIFKLPDLDDSRKGEVIPITVPEATDMPVKTLEIVREASAGVQLEDARVIVAGGAGCGGPDGWKVVRELAETLDACMGCTRPVVDEGWASLDIMIGQSGKIVSPEVYIAVALSGEQQHMVGIAGAQLIIAINNDPKSPIFSQVDIGVVENCQEFLPVLISKIKARCEKSDQTPAHRK